MKNQYLKQFCRTAWPVVMEEILLSLMNAVDTMMVGTIGKEAIAATGLANQPRLLLLVPVQALNMGVMTVVGMNKGAGNREKANRCLNTGIILSLCLSLVMMLIAWGFTKPIMMLVGAQPDTLITAMEYFRIVAIGCVFHSICLTITAGQRGIGKTGISLTTNLSANIINVCLNYVLINGKLGFPVMGVRGAAIATMLGNLSAMHIAIAYVARKNGYLRIVAGYGYEKIKSLGFMLKVARGGLGERLGHRAGMILFSCVAAYLGTTEFAAHTICLRFTSMSWSIGDGLGVAASSLVAQSLGAKNKEDAIAYGNTGLRVGLVAAVLYSLAILLFRKPLIGLFTLDNTVTAMCAGTMFIIAANALIHIPQSHLLATLRGAGDTAFLARVAFISTTVVRPAAAWILAYPCKMGLQGIYAALMIDVIMRFIFSVTRYRTSKWMDVGLQEACK